MHQNRAGLAPPASRVNMLGETSFIYSFGLLQYCSALQAVRGLSLSFHSASDFNNYIIELEDFFYSIENIHKGIKSNRVERIRGMHLRQIEVDLFSIRSL